MLERLYPCDFSHSAPCIICYRVKESLKACECQISANQAAMNRIRRRVEEKVLELTMNVLVRTTDFLIHKN